MMKNLLTLFCILFLISCGTKSDPTIVFGVAPMLSDNQADTTFSANGDTIIMMYKKVINVKCDTITTTDSVKTLRKYVPPVTTPPVITGTRKNLILDAGFEGATPFAGWGQEVCNQPSITQSTNYAREGKASYKVLLHKTDVCDQKKVSSIRAEIKRSTEPNHIERWYGVSYYWPNFQPDKSSCPEIIFQWHQSGGGSPPLALWVNGNKLQINQYDIANKRDKQAEVGTVVSGKWIDVVFHIKFSNQSDGLTEVWVNGVKKYSKTGINNYNSSTYLKTGIYKWGWYNGYSSSLTQREMYIDAIRIGNEKATYNDVAP